MSQYFIDILGSVEQGAKARRLGWPKDGNGKNAKPIKFIQTLPEGAEIQVPGVSDVKPATDLLLIDNTPENKELKRPKGVNQIGWKPSEEERLAMDWEVFDVPKK